MMQQLNVELDPHVIFAHYHLIHQVDAEEHLHKIVYDERFAQLEGFAILHVRWSSVCAEVEVGGENHEKRSRRGRQEPRLCSFI